jgi:streptogramin lyase
VNASTRVVSPSARVGDEASGLAVGSDAAWVGDLGGSLYRVDAETLQVERFEIGAEVLGVAVDPADDEAVWLYLGAPVNG